MVALVSGESVTNSITNEEPAASGELLLLVVVLGPTASGKTGLAVRLAESFPAGGEVVSCDSVAVYRELEIGTAKPSLAERSRVPHHLIDVVGPADPFTAGQYSRAARAAIQQISARGRVPVVAGGTGLYLRALLEGLFPESVSDESGPLRERLRQTASNRGAEYVHRLLQKVDRAAAERIHPNDVPKVVRAIEASISAGRPMTEAWEAGREGLRGYRVVKIGLAPDRAALYEHINQRAEEMFRNGLVEETRALVAKYGADCRPLGSLGYRQAQAVLRGEMTDAEAIAATAQGHRNYAKRQMTWFRREAGVRWLAGFGDTVTTEAESFVKSSGTRDSGNTICARN
jgi:tRNA dimethylallyltransferase